MHLNDYLINSQLIFHLIKKKASENMKFPFFSSLITNIKKDDWNLYSVEDDFNSFFPNKESCDWRISDVNIDYKV